MELTEVPQMNGNSIIPKCKEKPPVLIVGFSRIQQIRNTLEKLISLGIESIYLALDYSISEEVRAKQISLVEEIQSRESRFHGRVKIWYRTRNHGVGVGIISALDWFFSNNEEGIILEDDLVFEEDFLLYCSKALDAYINEREVLLISGNRFDTSLQNRGMAATNFPQIWGWATWRDRWVEIRKLILTDKRLPVKSLLRRDVCFFFAGAKRTLNGNIDTWDLPLAYEMLVKGKLCILPDVNLVSNIGSDVFSTHTKANNFPMNYPIGKTLTNEMPSLSFLRPTIGVTNRFLESQVFRIHRKHLLAPLKVFTTTLFSRETRISKPTSLVFRLERAERFE
jgi:hypothetical protein